MYYLDRSHKPKAVFRVESPNETDFDFDNADRIDVEGEETDYRCPHVFIDEGLWYMYYGSSTKNERATQRLPMVCTSKHRTSL